MHTVQKSITAYYEGLCSILHSLFTQNSCCSALKLIFVIKTLFSCSYTKETIHDWIMYQFKSNLSKLQETSWVAVWIKWSLNKTNHFETKWKFNKLIWTRKSYIQCNVFSKNRKACQRSCLGKKRITPINQKMVLSFVCSFF